jgi:hypothetical protein
MLSVDCFALEPKSVFSGYRISFVLYTLYHKVYDFQPRFLFKVSLKCNRLSQWVPLNIAEYMAEMYFWATLRRSSVPSAVGRNNDFLMQS